MIASVALVHGLTLAAGYAADYPNIPGHNLAEVDTMSCGLWRRHRKAAHEQSASQNRYGDVAGGIRLVRFLGDEDS